MIEPYPRSYYAATALPATERPALKGESFADVCVVGGGYTGLSAALHCAEAGYDTVLLEANRIGWGASGRNGGQAIPGLRSGAAALLARFGETRAKELMAVSLAARDHFWRRIDRHRIACDPKHGHLTAAARSGDMTDLETEVDAFEMLTGAGDLRLLAREAVRAAVGSDAYHGGLLDMSGGHVHSLNLALGLASAAEDAGATLHEGSKVTSIEGDHHPMVRTENGQVRARHVVLACDAELGSLMPDLRSRTMLVGNYNIATEPLGPLVDGVLPSDWAVADTKFALNYFRLSADRRLIFAGGEKYLPTPPRDPAAFVRPHMLKLFPQLGRTRIDYAWGGQVALTLTRFPHVGRCGDIFFAHGYSGQGVMLASFMGALIAEAMAGTAERFDLFKQLPVPPFPGGMLLRQPLYVAGMLWYALRDRL